MMGEQRRHRRVPMETTVRLRYRDLETMVERCSANISLGGMFIESEEPLEAGSTFSFELTLDDGRHVISGEATVEWQRDSGDSDGRPPGMGVRFIRLDEQSPAVIFSVL